MVAVIILSRSIKKSDNTNPVALQGSLNVGLDKANNSASEQAGNEDPRTTNNENIRERIPRTLEEKHATIVAASHVDKSTVKTGGEGETTLDDRNGPPDRQRHGDIIPEDDMEVCPPHVSLQPHIPHQPLALHQPHVPDPPPHQPHTPDQPDPEIYEELESHIREEPPDRFNDAIEEQGYDEQRSLLVTGRVLPTPILADRRNPQPQNNLFDNETNQLIFPPQHRSSSEQEPSSESIPLPFYWPAED